MTLEATPLTYQPCPQCKAPMPIVRGFVTWCESCNWNVRPQEKNRRYSMQERILIGLGQRSGRALVEELKQNPPTKPGFHFSSLLAWLIAFLVHAFTLLFLGVGVWLLTIFWQWGNWFALLGAIILLGVAWVTRPQFGKTPPTLPRTDYPVLYGVVDQIAETMQSRTPAGIAISPEYNASFGRYGWQQKETIALGLPLLLTLKGQEKVALIVHELAHGVSGDPLRGAWLGFAIRTLQQWVYLLRPVSKSNVGRGTSAGALVDISSFISNLIGMVIEKVVYAILYLMAVLTYRDSQRAEYRADYLSAQVSGTNGALLLLDKSYLTPNFYTHVQRMASSVTNTTDIFTEFNVYLATLPTREKERLHRANLMEGARLDASHPPTAHRIEVLQAHPVQLPKVTLASDVEKQLEQELAKLRQPVQRNLLENFRRYLYY
jgi:Zn-dependent protease with chaperone function